MQITLWCHYNLKELKSRLTKVWKKQYFFYGIRLVHVNFKYGYIINMHVIYNKIYTLKIANYTYLIQLKMITCILIKKIIYFTKLCVHVSYNKQY